MGVHNVRREKEIRNVCLELLIKHDNILPKYVQFSCHLKTVVYQTKNGKQSPCYSLEGCTARAPGHAIPTPGSNEVVIRNHAVAINFIDNLQRNFGFKVPFYPIVIGADVSGVVNVFPRTCPGL